MTRRRAASPPPCARSRELLRAPADVKKLAVGATAEFGEADVLIRAENDAETIERALRYLEDYFPGVLRHELEVLAHCPVAGYGAGSELVTADEARDSAGGPLRRLSAGALIGEITAIAGESARRTLVATSGVTAIGIPFCFPGAPLDDRVRGRIDEPDPDAEQM